MSLLLLAPERDMQPWKEALLEVDSKIDIDIWPEVSNKKNIQFIVAWNHPSHVLDSYPNLKTVSSLGAGVDHILRDESLPEKVEVCRVVCPSLKQQMQEYVLMSVLNYQRNTKQYFKQQQKGKWQGYENRSPDDFSIGIMGLGKLGEPTATLLAKLGYNVNGWSNSQKTIDGVTTYAGNNKLSTFLNETNVLVCMLPLTSQTKEILNLETFKQLKEKAYLINVARGEHLVEEDLIYALDKGLLEGAALDVFLEEPLPEKHPFWNRENITITPHVSSLTQPKEAAEQIVENYKRTLSGMELSNQVNKEQGY